MGAISVSPSFNWDGNDGPWSSFALRIGVPAQTISVLPATSKSNVWAVSPEWCPYMTAVGDCDSFFGGLYNSSASTNFDRIQISNEQPFFELPFIPELPLGYEGNATFGTDIVGFEGGEVLQKQAVSAFAKTSPFLATGLLGLSDQPLNITDVEQEHTSPLSTLHETKRIPSKFWGYNAGARYMETRPLASLTLGGYDAGRGGQLKDALKVPMRANIFRDLVISVQRISIGDKVIEPAVEAYIDSVVPELWLPEPACKVFEDAFALQWNESAQMYLLNDQHRELLFSEKTAKINFTLADPADASNSIEISFAYGAFGLEARYPLAGIQDDSVLYYFPLKRANESTGYYLGHAFLQEAYLAADYNRSEFYLSQAIFLDTVSDIKTVFPPGHHEGLSTGAIVGIAIGIVVVALLIASAIVWYCCRPRWRKRRNSRFLARIEAENVGLPDTQLPGSQGTEMQEYYAKRPLSPDSDVKQELDATTTARGSITSRAEMESPSQSAGGSPRKIGSRRTSYGFPTSPAELESRSPRMMHSRTASGSSIEPMSPLSGRARTELGPTEEVHELP